LPQLCLHTLKILIKISDIFYEAQHSQKFGIDVGSISLDAKRMLEWRMNVSKKLENGVDFLCKSNGVEVVKGMATFLNSSTLQLTNGTSLEFKKGDNSNGL